MKKVLLLSPLVFLFSLTIHAQYVHKIKADSVLITNDSCNAELNLENFTKTVKGFLYNKGNGRTEFRRGAVKFGDSAYVIGADTIVVGIGNYWSLNGNTGTTSANFLGTISYKNLPFRTNNIQRMVIDSIGKVGIGTATPNVRLDINPNGKDFSGYMPTIWANSAARINGGNLSIFSTGDTTVAGDSYQLDFYARYFNSGQAWTTNKSGFVKGRTLDNQTMFPVQPAGQGVLILGTSNTNYNTTSFIDVPTVYINNGDVGIGVVSPATKFQIADTSGGMFFDTRLSRTNDRIRFGFNQNKNDGQNIIISTSSDGGTTFKKILVERDGSVGLGTGNAGSPSWQLSTLGSLRVHSDGRAGVGANYFHFGNFGGPSNSSSLVTYVSNTNEWLESESYPNGQNYYYFGTILQGPSDTSKKRAPLRLSGKELQFFTSAADTEAGRFTTTGNLLVGTTSDSGYRLDVNGTARIQSLPFISSRDTVLTYDPTSKQLKVTKVISGSNAWFLAGNSGNTAANFLGTIDNYRVPFRTNNTERMVIDSTGKVGIGVTNPTEKLSIYGDLKFTDPNPLWHIKSMRSSIAIGEEPGSAYLFHGDTTSSTIQVGAGHTNKYHKFIFQSAGQGGDNTAMYNFIYDQTLGNAFQVYNFSQALPKFTIAGNGNVGILTATPAYNLDVNGSTRISDLPFIAKRDTLLTYDPATKQVKATKIYSVNMLSSDVTNSSGTANSIADVTGLSFPVVANTTYRFKFYIVYTAAATTTGSRWSVNGPSISGGFLHYRSEYGLTTTSITTNQGMNGYNSPSASNASSAATGSNIAIIEGIIRPTANGNVIARFASEVSSSAIVAKGGMSYVEFEILQ